MMGLIMQLCYAKMQFKQNIGFIELLGYALNLKMVTEKSGGSIPIIVFDYITGEELSRHTSITKAATFYKVFHSGIMAVLRGRNKHCRNMTFKKYIIETD